MMSRILKRLVFELDYLKKKKKNINDEIDGERGGRVSKRINFPWKIESPVTT